jgi:hypothetical protein
MPTDRFEVGGKISDGSVIQYFMAKSAGQESNPSGGDHEDGELRLYIVAIHEARTWRTPQTRAAQRLTGAQSGRRAFARAPWKAIGACSKRCAIIM